MVEPVWNPFWSVTNVIGSAWMARDHLTGPFVYLHADTVFEPSILDDLLAAPGPAVLPVDLRPCEPEQMKARIEDGRILHLSKELSRRGHRGRVHRDRGVPGRRAGPPSARASTPSSRPGTLTAYFEAALNHAIDAGLDLHPVPTAGRAWTEIDFEADLELARSILPRLTPPG